MFNCCEISPKDALQGSIIFCIFALEPAAAAASAVGYEQLSNLPQYSFSNTGAMYNFGGLPLTTAAVTGSSTVNTSFLSLQGMSFQSMTDADAAVATDRLITDDQMFSNLVNSGEDISFHSGQPLNSDEVIQFLADNDLDPSVGGLLVDGHGILTAGRDQGGMYDDSQHGGKQQ